MFFSNILKNLNSLKEAKKRGVPIVKYDITPSEVKRDFFEMRRIYNNLSSLTASECRDFAKEIDSFFIILNKVCCSVNSLTLEQQQELQSFLDETKIIRDHVSLVSIEKSSYKESEADNN